MLLILHKLLGTWSHLTCIRLFNKIYDKKLITRTHKSKLPKSFKKYFFKEKPAKQLRCLTIHITNITHENKLLSNLSHAPNLLQSHGT